MHHSDVDWHTDIATKATKPIARNMEQAFGPHCRQKLEPMHPEGTPAERIAAVVFCVAVSICAAIWIVHELSK